MLRDFIRDDKSVHTLAGFYQWLRAREDAFILAYLAHGCNTGSVGTEQGFPIWAGGAPASYPLDWKSLLSVDGGGYQLYCRGPLSELNIIKINDGGLHDDLTKTIGLGLADAFAESVAGTAYVQRYLDATRLTKADIEGFAQHACLCQLHTHDLERRRLVDAFFRFDTPDVAAVKRLETLCLFLDIIAQSEGKDLSELDIRAVLYFWSFPDQRAYQPEGNLLRPAQRWRVFQLRQYFVFAIESFWSLFLNRISTEALSGPEYLGWLLSELDLNPLADEFGLALPSTDPDSLTLQAFYEAIRHALPTGALDPGSASTNTNLNERAVIGPIWHSDTGLNAQIRAGRALAALALMYWRCQPWQQGPGWYLASDRYGAGRLPIEGYLRHVNRAFAEGWSLTRWLDWFHQQYLWLQHRRVVLEKLVARRQDTAKFEVVDGTPTDVVTDSVQSSVQRFKGLGSDWPKMNAPRFPSALNILLDLRVVEPAPAGGFQLSADGTALLNRFRSYTIPDSTGHHDDQAADLAHPATGG
jgi:hypothetical protein